MYKHIMLPFNGSEPSQRAEKECIALAQSIGASVTVLHVIRHRRLMVEEEQLTDLIQDLERDYDVGAKRSAWSMLAEVEKCARARGVECHSLVVFGEEPHREILNNAVSRDCDLVVMATRKRRILQGIVSRSETDRVLTHSTIPVLVVD